MNVRVPSCSFRSFSARRPGSQSCRGAWRDGDRRAHRRMHSSTRLPKYDLPLIIEWTDNARALKDESSPSGLTSRAVGLNRSELDSDCVSRIRRMLQCVSVSASTAVLLPTAPKRTADEAEPEIRSEAATFVGARSETCELKGQHQLVVHTRMMDGKKVAHLTARASSALAGRARACECTARSPPPTPLLRSSGRTTWRSGPLRPVRSTARVPAPTTRFSDPRSLRAKTGLTHLFVDLVDDDILRL